MKNGSGENSFSTVPFFVFPDAMHPFLAFYFPTAALAHKPIGWHSATSRAGFREGAFDSKASSRL
ncbi:MAG: hypothetical protein IJE17_12320 [Clostridia bacterium]|nr:hypothetical protein [Clostridia bacterium]MBQ6805724.1 hypothetical protein [Clostridia bacterium]